jgi:hypothetical protein
MRFFYGLCLAVLTASSFNASGAEPAAKVTDHITARRIDIVDDKGVVRMILAAPTPDPVVGGKVYKRAFPVAGMVLFDANGDERGGYGVADIPGSAVVLAVDHTNGDAMGWRVMPDGSISFVMNSRAPVAVDANGKTKAALGQTRAQLTVGADGAPSLSLNDKDEHPRIRLAITAEGYGALEFLDKDGKVVNRLVPEAK